MIDQSEADTGKRMGRPPLNMTRIPVRLPPEDLAAIDARVGTYGRPAFIREAVAEKLAREKKGRTDCADSRDEVNRG